MGLDKSFNIDLKSRYEAGKRDLISDVPGVTVGHCTIKSEDGSVNTGVTVVMPHQGNIFREKLPAASAVINGFGKTAGLVQIDELGTLESPIFMTNTLSVGTVLTGAVRFMLGICPEIGDTTGTVNCVVTECNDGFLNDIRGLHVREEDVFTAIGSASEDFEEGAVGGGTGMKMMGLKGGIGSASRVFEAGGRSFTVGAIVMSNYGAMRDLTIGTDRIGRRITEARSEDKGSCIIVVATDAPLSDRQLARLARRSAHALARTGSYSGNGSGDVAIAFSTANRIPHVPEGPVMKMEVLHEDFMSIVFEAGTEAMEEALISSLVHADTTEGYKGRVLKSVREYL
ncbi:MAG: P1 family peptidase [Firmicutes bacterium]|nr:P1 family peptidase [Bacillota bacterium]MBR0441201.1 P1 family peptidase [Bacillota bacterium]